MKNWIISNKELEEELHKPVISKFNNRKVHPPFINNIWGAHLADMQLISKFNKGFRFLLCVIDYYSKYLMLLMILMDKKLLELFTQRNCKKQIKKNVELKK